MTVDLCLLFMLQMTNISGPSIKLVNKFDLYTFNKFILLPLLSLSILLPLLSLSIVDLGNYYNYTSHKNKWNCFRPAR